MSDWKTATDEAYQRDERLARLPINNSGFEDNTADHLDDFTEVTSLSSFQHPLSSTEHKNSQEENQGDKYRRHPYDVTSKLVVGVIDLPTTLVLNPTQNASEGAELKVSKTRISFDCHIPSQFKAGKWFASMGGTSGTAAKMGFAEGRLLLGTNVGQGQAVACKVCLGDQSQVTYGLNLSSKDGSLMQANMHCFSRHKWSSISSPMPPVFSLMASDQVLVPDKLVGSLALGVGTNCTFSFLNFGVRTVVEDAPILAVGLGLNGTMASSNCFSYSGDVMNVSNSRLPIKVSITAPGNTTHQESGGIASLAVGFQGQYELQVMLTRALSTKYAFFGIGVSHSTVGLSWLLRLERGDIQFNVPICISPIKNTAETGLIQTVKLLYLSFLSFLVHAAVGEFFQNVTTTFVNEQDCWSDVNYGSSNSASMQREEVMLCRKKAREDAERQTLLMKRKAMSNQKIEEEKDGLIIVKATYGVEGGDVLDAATQLQFWVVDSKLQLPASSKKDMLGFYDVKSDTSSAFNTADAGWWHWKKLWQSSSRSELQRANVVMLTVTYKFEGRLFETAIQDEEALMLPTPRAKPLDWRSSFRH